jgi:hypothetical protein
MGWAVVGDSVEGGACVAVATGLAQDAMNSIVSVKTMTLFIFPPDNLSIYLTPI